MTHDPTFWILARASGLTAYLLLTGSMLAGLVLKSRPVGKALRPAAVTDLHRTLALAALGMAVLHGVALVLDSTVAIGPLALVVPGLVPYRPVWSALGVVSAELLAVLIASFSLRRRIGTRAWRRLHWASYAVFVAATAHGLATGSDSGTPWARGLYVGAIGAVACATAFRALYRPTAARSRRTSAAREPGPVSSVS
jgi:sulfoxide reductase heme-binding subunit YedZ